MVDKASLSRGAFLLCLSHTGNLTIAAEFAGVKRAQILAAMAEEEGFQAAVAEAMAEAEERVFHHAMRRAIEGVKVPRFYQGAIIGYVRMPSDILLRYVLERLGTNQMRAAEDARPDEGAETIANGVQVQARLRAKLAEWLNDHNEP